MARWQTAMAAMPFMTGIAHRPTLPSRQIHARQGRREGLFLQPESGFQRHLEMGDGAIDDVAAGFHHFEPVQVLHRL